MKGTIFLPKLDGGLATAVIREELNPDQSPEMLNMISDQFGNIRTRRNNTFIGLTKAGGAGPWELINYRKADGTEQLLMVNGGDLYVWTGTTSDIFASAWGSAVTNSSGVFATGTARISSVQYQGRLYMTDGLGVRVKYNGTHLLNWGVATPGVAPTLAIGVGGTLNGNYYYGYTDIDEDGVESSVSPTSLVISVSTNGVFVTMPAVPTGIGAVASRNIYRTAANGTTLQLLALQTPANTVYSDTGAVADNALGVLAPTDNGRPPSNVRVVIAFKDRLWMAVDNASVVAPNFDRLYYCEATQPGTWSALGYINFTATNEKVKGLAPTGDQIFVIKERSIWELDVLDATDPSNWFVKKTNVNFGGEAPFAVVPYDNYFLVLNRTQFMVLGHQGVMMSSYRTQYEGLYSNNASRYIYDMVQQFTLARFDYVSAINYNNRVWITLSISSSSIFAGSGQAGTTYNNLVLIFDYLRGDAKMTTGGWFPLNGAAMSIDAFARYGSNLYGISRFASSVYQLDSNDLGHDTLNTSGSSTDVFLQGFVTKAMEGQKGHMNERKLSRALRLNARRIDFNLFGTTPVFYALYFPDVGGTTAIVANSFVTTNLTWSTVALPTNGQNVPADYLVNCNRLNIGLRHLIGITNRKPDTGVLQDYSISLYRITEEYDTLGTPKRGGF